MEEWLEEWEEEEGEEGDEWDVLGLYGGDDVCVKESGEVGKGCGGRVEMKGENSRGWRRGWGVKVYGGVEERKNG